MELYPMNPDAYLLNGDAKNYTYQANLTGGLKSLPLPLPSNVIRVEQPAQKETPTQSES